MSSFEDAVVATLRADADDASRSTDTSAEWQALRDRLDAADRASTRRRWGGLAAIAAVAAAAVVLAMLVVGRPTAEVPPAEGTRWTEDQLYTQPQLEVPAWASGIRPLVSAPRLARWAQDDCGQNPCEAGKDRSLTLFLPLTAWDAAKGMSGDVLTWEAAANYFGELTERPGVVPVQQPAFTQQATGAAGVANVAVITTTEDVPGALGCTQLASSLGDCQSLVRGTRNVIALINAGDAPLVVWSSALASTDAAAQDAEMTAVLASLRLTGLPVSCTDSVSIPTAKASCATDLFARIQRDATLLADGQPADQSDFDAAVRPYVESLDDPLTGYLSGYSRGPFDGDNTQSTKPTTATLTVAGEKTTTNVCFVGPQVILTPNPCT